MQPVTPTPIRDFSRGLIQGVENPNMPPNAVSHVINAHFDRISTVTLRPGIVRLGAQISGSSSSLTKSPDPNPETNTVDGRVQRDTTTTTTTFNPTQDGWAGRQSAAEESWATRRAGAGDLVRDQDDGTSEAVSLRKGTTNAVYNIFRRGFFSVDTSSIPDGATITAAKLRIYVNSKTETIASQSLTLCNGAMVSNTQIAASDFEANVAATTIWAPAKTLASITTGAYNEWEFNATGLTGVSLTGFTKFSLIYESDRANTEPTGGAAADVASVDFNFGNAVSNKSEFVVTYTVPPNETLATIRAGLGTAANDSEASGNAVRLLASSTSNQYDELRRAILAFDTQGVPDPAVIDSANLRLYVNSVTQTIGGQSLGVVQGTSASNTALAAGDFETQTYTVRQASDKTIAGLTTGAYNSYSLNATGIGNINKQGLTKFALKLSADIDNTAPTWVSGASAAVNIDFADGTNDPELVVNYTVGSNVLGLHQFLDSGSGTNNRLMVQAGGIMYYRADDGSWTSLDTTRNSTDKERFVNALDFVFYTNQTNGIKTWNGATASVPGTTNAVSSPAVTYLEYYKSKVYGLRTTSNPDRLFFSSVPSTSGTITWDTTNDYVDINPSDGENGTGLKRIATELLIFKRNYLYRFYGVQGTDPDPIINVGTHSHESIVVAKNGCYFHHPSGIYLYQGGQPQEISRPIKDVISGVALSQYDDVAGWKDDDHVYHSLGDITLEGVTYTNVVSRYTISTQAWTLYSYPNLFLFGITYDDGTTLSQVVADNNSSVHTFNSGTTDNSAAIFYQLVTKWYETTSLAQRFTISQIAAYCDKAAGMNLSYQVDTENPNTWHSIMTLPKFVSVSAQNLKITGSRVRFRVHGSSNGEAWVFSGLEILSGMLHELAYA